MRKIICDICGNEFKSRGGEITGDFNLHKSNKEVCAVAIMDVKMNFRFNTTDFDVCRDCLIRGIKSANLT